MVSFKNYYLQLLNEILIIKIKCVIIESYKTK